MKAILLMASSWSPTPAEKSLNLVMTILGLVFWFYVIKGVVGLWKRAPDSVKSAAKAGATNQAVRIIQKWLR